MQTPFIQELTNAIRPLIGKLDTGTAFLIGYFVANEIYDRLSRRQNSGIDPSLSKSQATTEALAEVHSALGLPIQVDFLYCPYCGKSA